MTPSVGAHLMSSKPGGIAARAGRWSARHKKTAILGWLAFVIVALVAGNMAGTKEPSDADSYDGESRAAAKMVDDAGFSEAAGEMVLVQSKTAHGQGRRVPRRRQGRRARRRRRSGRDQRRIALRQGRHGLRGRPFRARPVRHQGRRREGRGQDRPRRWRRSTRSPAQHSDVSIGAVRRRQRQQGARRVARRPSRAARR